MSTTVIDHEAGRGSRRTAVPPRGTARGTAERQPQPAVRLTRRGRVVVLVSVLALALALFTLFGAPAASTDHVRHVPATTVVVQPGADTVGHRAVGCATRGPAEGYRLHSRSQCLVRRWRHTCWPTPVCARGLALAATGPGAVGRRPEIRAPPLDPASRRVERVSPHTWAGPFCMW
jgi:hypothetical protein